MARLDPEEIGLHSLRPKAGSRHSRKRLGRGKGSGQGKTAGRGHKGQGARAGSKRRVGYEGGQNPINLVKATMDGLHQLRRPQDVAKLRGLSVNQVLGLDKMAEAKKLRESESGDAVDVTPTPVAVAVAEEAPAEEASDA